MGSTAELAVVVSASIHFSASIRRSARHAVTDAGLGMAVVGRDRSKKLLGCLLVSLPYTCLLTREVCARLRLDRG